MADIIKMPKLSDTMEEGVIANWLKKEGDTVKEGDLLAEIETDKATMEYEAPVSGVILKHIAQPGKKLSLGEAITVIGKKGESFDPATLGAKGEPAASAPAKVEASKTPAQATTTTSAPATAVAQGRVIASPLAKKVAQEKGVDLHAIQGSGPNGRIIVKDLDGASAGAGKSVTAPQRMIASGEDRVVPASMMRQTIAKRLHAAKNEAPHFYLTRSIDMTNVLAWRQRLNANAEKANTPKVSVNDIIMMASAKALKYHPGVNASWQGESILEYGSVHVAMAVALPTGLITPVIRNCDQLGVREIAGLAKDLAARAKKGGLKPEEYAGGTFTVSNLGMLGIEEFTAIINPPQAAILAVGATMAVPWVNDKGAIVAVERMKVTLSCDHRVIDGAMGAQFLQTLAQFLEDPLAMLA